MGGRKATVKHLTFEEFKTLSEDKDFLRAMSSYRSFTADDVGKVYTILPDPFKEGTIWYFNVHNHDLDLKSVVSHYKLKNTKEKASGLSWVDYVRSNKKLPFQIKFTEYEAVKNRFGKFIFPKNYYDFAKIGAQFKMEEDDVLELLYDEWDKLSAVDKQKRQLILRWARSQPYKDVLPDNDVTKDGDPTEEVMKLASGVLTFTILEEANL
jgi:hypothetical protein